jgi:hypothetical protein
MRVLEPVRWYGHAGLLRGPPAGWWRRTRGRFGVDDWAAAGHTVGLRLAESRIGVQRLKAKTVTVRLSTPFECWVSVGTGSGRAQLQVVGGFRSRATLPTRPPTLRLLPSR